jgi:hypothetical protein
MINTDGGQAAPAFVTRMTTYSRVLWPTDVPRDGYR